MLALCGLASSGLAATATARPRQVPQSSTELNLTISEGSVSVAALRARTLMCHPTGGNHPHGDVACRDVDAAGGNLDRLPGEPGKVCSGVYKPVTVNALGEWRGIPVRFDRTYRNACKMTASTGLVFEF
jgi:hypothetical protein